MGKKKFATVVLDSGHEAYLIHVVSLSSTPLIASLGSTLLHVLSFQRLQISGLIAKEALTKVSNKYTHFADVFSLDFVSKLSKHTVINDHTLKLVVNQQPPYKLIYSLGPVELKTLKAYIEINLANGFIRPSKSPVVASILFNRKLDGSFRLCVDYWGLNNLTIKNWYLLPFVTAESHSLSRGKGHWMYSLGNLDTYCTKRKETGSYLENKYCGR